MFFVCLLSRFGITKFVITETQLISDFQNNYGFIAYRGRFVVVHLYSTFSVDPQNFPIGVNLYQKLPFLRL